MNFRRRGNLWRMGNGRLFYWRFFLGCQLFPSFGLLDAACKTILQNIFCIHISICHHLCRLLHFLGNCEQKMKTEVQPWKQNFLAVFCSPPWPWAPHRPLPKTGRAGRCQRRFDDLCRCRVSGQRGQQGRKNLHHSGQLQKRARRKFIKLPSRKTTAASTSFGKRTPLSQFAEKEKLAIDFENSQYRLVQFNCKLTGLTVDELSGEASASGDSENRQRSPPRLDVFWRHRRGRQRKAVPVLSELWKVAAFEAE